MAKICNKPLSSSENPIVYTGLSMNDGIKGPLWGLHTRPHGVKSCAGGGYSTG